MQMTQKVSFHKLFFKDLSNGQIWLKRGWTESRCDFIEQIWAKEHPCFRFHIQYRIHSNFGINYLHHSTLEKALIIKKQWIHLPAKIPILIPPKPSEVWRGRYYWICTFLWRSSSFYPAISWMIPQTLKTKIILMHCGCAISRMQCLAKGTIC